MIKGLDGLRALAVLAVMTHHFGENYSFLYQLNLGHFGVMLFFVLSGFLISRIIFLQKQREIDTKRFFTTFYARRTLRIFPLYYLSIVIFSAVGIGFGNKLLWHVCYGSNFLLSSDLFSKFYYSIILCNNCAVFWSSSFK